MNILIFGAGFWGQRLAAYILNNTSDNVLGFIDNSVEHKTKLINRIDSFTPSINEHEFMVYNPNEIKNLLYDLICISVEDDRAQKIIYNQLKSLNVEISMISIFMDNRELYKNVVAKVQLYNEKDARINWIKQFAKYVSDENMSGDVAECGVNWGDSAHFINKYFVNRKFYLFDTFEGFNSTDLKKI